MEIQGIKDEHVPEIERYIRTVKERARAILPFDIMQHRLIIKIVYNAIILAELLPTQRRHTPC